MHYRNSLIFTALLSYLVAATPIPVSGNLVSKQGVVHISRAAKDTRGNHTISATLPNCTGAKGSHTDDQDKDGDDDDVLPGDLFEGDSDSGGESKLGNTAVSVANGILGSGGVGSAGLNSNTSGSASVFCSLFVCASAAQSDGKVSTSSSEASINATGPVISITGPLIVVQIFRALARLSLTATN